MTVRAATVEDLSLVEAIASEFHASSEFIRGFNFSRFVQVWTEFLNSGSGCIFLLMDGGTARGMLGGYKYPDLYSGEMIAMEFFWYVTPAARGRGLELYRRFEEWAREQGCSLLRMVHLADSMPDRLRDLYTGRLGMTMVETHYQKELN